MTVKLPDEYPHLTGPMSVAEMIERGFVVSESFTFLTRDGEGKKAGSDA